MQLVFLGTDSGCTQRQWLAVHILESYLVASYFRDAGEIFDQLSKMNINQEDSDYQLPFYMCYQVVVLTREVEMK